MDLSSGEPLRPLNIWSRSDEEVGRMLSNFAYTPFELDGIEYASVEAFYVCLLLPDEARREKVRRLWGIRAKHETPKVTRPAFEYGGSVVQVGSAEHHELIKRASRAKLQSHPALARAFAETAPRPLVHETGYPDGGAFPAAVLCRILEELRNELCI
jgi:predicted NAD-dependent protein-ADP-ribosyltransferase YbiA (DUF1768 family)